MAMPPWLSLSGVTDTGLAAASWLGAASFIAMLRAASAKGRTRKLSPTAPAPPVCSKRRPSRLAGRLPNGVRTPSDRRSISTPVAVKLTR